jgi:hypothetical protein
MVDANPWFRISTLFLNGNKKYDNSYWASLDFALNIDGIVLSQTK